MNLDGITVFDLTQLLPGPYGSQILADMGAAVIKIEPPGGEPARLVQQYPGWAGYVFPTVNDGKKSVTLDLKQEEGQEVFYDLVADADVVFEQFRPGVVERLGIDYETLREHNEEIIYCSLSGYGQTGPYADRAGHDLNYVGIAGLADMTRESSDGRPVGPGYPIADMGGGLMAVTSILGALLSRELDAGGEYIDLALTDAVLSFGQIELAMAAEGENPRPGTTPIAGGLPWYGIYETSDGRYVTLAALEPRFWMVFCEAIERPDLVEYHMTQEPDELAWVRDQLAEEFAAHTRDEWEKRLGAIDDAMFGVVNTPAEAIEDPHVDHRDLLERTDDGRTRLPFPAQTASASHDGSSQGDSTGSTYPSDPSGTPAVGEHTTETLTSAGYTPEEIESLANQDVI